MGNGKYAAARKLTRPDGKPISDGYAQAPCLGDWDGDGDLDMALGVIQGPVKLYRNHGDLTFSEAGTFKVDGKPLIADDAGPCIVDWDGDGIKDLLLGDGEGNVRFYKGTAKGSLNLTADENTYILPQRSITEAYRPQTSLLGAKRPGVRTKPFAADWNGDGKLDLLVGDFLEIQRPKPKLGAAQIKRKLDLAARQKVLQTKLTTAARRISQQAMKAAGITSLQHATPDQTRKWNEAYSEAARKDKDYESVTRQFEAIRHELGPLQGEMEYTGVVWVYLRR